MISFRGPGVTSKGLPSKTTFEVLVNPIKWLVKSQSSIEVEKFLKNLTANWFSGP